MKNSKKFKKSLANWYNNRLHWSQCKTNQEYLARHPELEYFDMPKTFYFRHLPDRYETHWAIIVPKDSSYRPRVTVYFINDYGRIFDKLEFKQAKMARRRLRKCGFDFSTNRYCPFTPMKPIYIQLSEGKKTAPYSKGNLFQSVQRDKKHLDKLEKTRIKQMAKYYELHKKWEKDIKQQKNYYKINCIQHQQSDKTSWLEIFLPLIILILAICLISFFVG